jgi:hypothetical protein
MRKTGRIAAVALLAALCLTGCTEKEPLPDSFDAEAVQEEAEKAIELFNEGDYQGIIDMGDENMKSSSTVEQFEETCDPLKEENGEFQEITDINLVGNESGDVKYGGAIVEVAYEEGDITFSIAFNEDMELVQFIIQ